MKRIRGLWLSIVWCAVFAQLTRSVASQALFVRQDSLRSHNINAAYHRAFHDYDDEGDVDHEVHEFLKTAPSSYQQQPYQQQFQPYKPHQQISQQYQQQSPAPSQQTPTSTSAQPLPQSKTSYRQKAPLQQQSFQPYRPGLNDQQQQYKPYQSYQRTQQQNTQTQRTTTQQYKKPTSQLQKMSQTQQYQRPTQQTLQQYKSQDTQQYQKPYLKDSQVKRPQDQFNQKPQAFQPKQSFPRAQQSTARPQESYFQQQQHQQRQRHQPELEAQSSQQVKKLKETSQASRAARIPTQPPSTVSSHNLDQTVQSILNWIQGMSRAQERRARQQALQQKQDGSGSIPSRNYLPAYAPGEEPLPRPRPFQPAPEEPARQGLSQPSRQYLPVPEVPVTEQPRPFTPSEAPPSGPAPETPAPGPAPETPAPGPAPETPAPETPAPEIPTEAPPAPETPAEETPAPPTAPGPAQETPAPETPAPETPAPTAPPTAPETPAPETPPPETLTPAPPTAPAPEQPAPPSAPETPAEPAPPSGPAEPPVPGQPAPPAEEGDHPPHIHAIDVQCAKDMMTINIEFDKPYDGIIYSKGYYKDPNCRYVNAGSGQTKYTFTVMLNSCGTQFVDDFMGTNQAYLENVIVLQNEEGIQEVWDSIRSVRCLWEGNLKQALSVALSVGSLNQEIVTFGGDTGMARLDIQMGRGPFAPAASGLVKIGELMTLVVSVEGDPAFDVQVRACAARDADSTNVVQLTDDQGCVLKPKLLGAFQKTKDTGNSGASIIAYAFFNAFKFPDVMDLIIECSVDLCKKDCEMCPNPNQKIEPGKRRRRSALLSGNMTDELDGTYEDDLGVTMGRHLRVFTPDELAPVALQEALMDAPSPLVGNEMLEFTSSPARFDGVCVSTPRFLVSSAILLSVLLSSCTLSIVLWIKLQRSRSKELDLGHH